MRTRFSILALGIGLLLVAGRSQAQTVVPSLDITPNPGLLSGAPGDTLTMNATLTNTTDASLNLSQIFLNGDMGSVDTLALDDTKFLQNAPTTLAQGASWTGDIFDVFIDPNVLQGTYQGSFTVFGGGSAGDLNTLGAQQFSVQVGVVPEPGSLALFLPALVPIGLVLKRRRTSSGI